MAPFDASPEEIDFDLLATYLKALSNPGRLEILSHLRVPATAADLDVKPRRKDNLSPDRTMSRQTILVHLEVLQEAGVVSRVPTTPGHADRWVTNVPQLFALVEELRKLTAIPPSAVLDEQETTATLGPARAAWTDGAKVVLVTGPWEGRVIPLAGPGPWSLGRSRSREVSLPYDPFVSSGHATIERAGDKWTLKVAAETRNPTSVNLAPLPAGSARPLAHGDIVTLGRSTLVFHAK